MRASMRSLRELQGSSPLLPPSFGVKIIAAMTVAAIVLRFSPPARSATRTAKEKCSAASSSGIIQWITGSLLAYLGKLSDADVQKFKAATGAERDVIVAQLSANAAAYHDRVRLMAGFGWAQFLIVLAVLPPILHQGLVFVHPSAGASAPTAGRTAAGSASRDFPQPTRSANGS